MAHIGHGLQAAEPRFETTDVSGYACGNSLEEAILSGLCEVVERDAFMIFWYHWLRVASIDLTSDVSAEVRETLSRYRDVPAQLFCSNITTDLGIPVVLSLLLSYAPGRPTAVIATAADSDPGKAINKALIELAANNVAVRWLSEERARRGVPPIPQAITTQEDHGLLYAQPHVAGLLEPLVRSHVVLHFRDLPGAATLDLKQLIESYVDRFATMGLEVIVVELTAPMFKELGFNVVKVLVPGLQPIDFAGIRHYGGKRLYEAPRRMGYSNSALNPSELNHFPHPFL